MSTSAKKKKSSITPRLKKLKCLVEISPTQMEFDFYSISSIAYSEIIATGKGTKKSAAISHCNNKPASISTFELELSH